MNRQEHLMTILTEECAEVQQAVTKALRFGLNDRRNISAANNAAHLRTEINDLLAVVEMLEAEGINLQPDYTQQAAKKAKVEKYLIYSAERGTLSFNDGLSKIPEEK